MTTEQEDYQKENRGENGRFKPGYSGNPGGRPKIAKYINEKTKDLKIVVDKVIDIFNDDNTDQKALQWAIDYLTDRSVGKPSQHQQTEDITPEPIEYVKKDKDGETSTGN